MLGKREILSLYSKLSKQKAIELEELWMNSYRSASSNIYIRIYKDKVSIIYKDFTKFRHEDLISTDKGYGGFDVLNKTRFLIKTRIGNFSRCDIYCNTGALKNRTLVLNTKYKENMSKYDNCYFAEHSVFKIVGSLTKFGLDLDISSVISEIALNIVQHNFLEGVANECEILRKE